MTHNLNNFDSKYVLNYITFKLADALGYPTWGDPKARLIDADPDEVLDNALRTILAARVAGNIVKPRR